MREVRALERSENWLAASGAVGGCGGLRGLLVAFFLRSGGEPLDFEVCAVLNISTSETCATFFGVDSSPEPSSSPPKGAGLRGAGADFAAPAFFRPNEKPGLLIVLSRPRYKRGFKLKLIVDVAMSLELQYGRKLGGSAPATSLIVKCDKDVPAGKVLGDFKWVKPCKAVLVPY